jgi:hypothetical protein
VAHVRGFGPAANTGVVLVGDKTRACVATIAVIMNATGSEQREVLDALVHIPSPAPLLLVDWVRGYVVAIDDGGSAIARYLDA